MRTPNSEEVKRIVGLVKAEDDLPTGAGEAFRRLIVDGLELNLGYREWEVISELVMKYLVLKPEDKEKVEKKLGFSRR